MADQSNPSERPPDFRVEVIEKLYGLAEWAELLKFWKWGSALLFNAAVAVVGWILQKGAQLGGVAAMVLVRGEDRSQEAFGKLAAVAVEDVFGVSVDPAAMNDRGNRGRRKEAANAIGAAVMSALTNGGDGGQNGPLQPSAAGAENFVSVVTQMALEGWLEGWIIELCSAGQIEQFGELDDIMAQVLGLGRMSRSVVRPLLDARVVTPFEWQVNKTYRPKLLTASEVARQVARGRLTREAALEELARQGYDDARIEALLNAAAKFHGVADLELLERAGQLTRAQAVQHLRDAGYDEAIATTELDLERLKRIAAFEQAMVSDAIAAYANHSIGNAELRERVRGVTIDDQEANRYIERAEALRSFRSKPLSPSEARACVKAGILAVSDYRRALREDGYDEDAVLALELLLRHELDEQARIEELRRQADEARAAEQAARDDERARRRADVEAERALARRGAESDLEDAAVRGLIPFARVEEVYRARYDADTVAILVEILEERRGDYLEAERRRADALRRAERRAVSIADLEEAVLANVVSLTDYRRRLEQLGFDAGDVAILFQTLEARKRAYDAAVRTRAAAEQAATKRGIDLGRLERLVRRGARTLAQYEAQLAALNFDEAAIAAMRELLELEIADADAARRAREEARANDPRKSLSLELLRRGVLLGTHTEADFERFLLAEGFTADAQIVLMAELRADVADAEAARRRRDEADASLEPRALPLSTLARAARLGLVSPATYQARLEALGYSADDVAIELELLLTEIAETQAARARRDEIEAELAGRGLGLDALARAVRRGLQPLEAYRARATELGYGPADVAILVRVLGDELRATERAKARREQLAADPAFAATALEELEAAARAGVLTVEEFVERLALAGLALDDAQLLGGVLLDELEGVGV